MCLKLTFKVNLIKFSQYHFEDMKGWRFQRGGNVALCSLKRGWQNESLWNILNKKACPRIAKFENCYPKQYKENCGFLIAINIIIIIFGGEQQSTYYLHSVGLLLGSPIIWCLVCLPSGLIAFIWGSSALGIVSLHKYFILINCVSAVWCMLLLLSNVHCIHI